MSVDYVCVCLGSASEDDDGEENDEEESSSQSDGDEEGESATDSEGSEPSGGWSLHTHKHLVCLMLITLGRYFILLVDSRFMLIYKRDDF